MAAASTYNYKISDERLFRNGKLFAASIAYSTVTDCTTKKLHDGNISVSITLRGMLSDFTMTPRQFENFIFSSCVRVNEKRKWHHELPRRVRYGSYADVSITTLCLYSIKVYTIVFSYSYDTECDYYKIFLDEKDAKACANKFKKPWVITPSGKLTVTTFPHAGKRVSRYNVDNIKDVTLTGTDRVLIRYDDERKNREIFIPYYDASMLIDALEYYLQVT